MDDINCMIEIGMSTRKIYRVNLQQASEKTFAAQNDTGDLLNIWNTRLAHSERNAITKMTVGGAVCGLDMIPCFPTSNVLPCVD